MRQAIIIPGWLNMSPGKVASQAAHVAARAKAESSVSKHEGTRIVLRANTPEQLFDVLGRAYAYPDHMTVTVFADSGQTTEGTDKVITAIAITAYAFENILTQTTAGLELY